VAGQAQAELAVNLGLAVLVCVPQDRDQACDDVHDGGDLLFAHLPS
jgi:hypothetical protein